MQNSIMKKIIAISLVILGIIGTGAYLVFKNSTIPKSQSQSNSIITVINPKDYSLIKYPLKQSPIYNQIDKECMEFGDSNWIDSQDARIVKSGNETIIPSLLQLISFSDGAKQICESLLDSKIFSAPADGKYLYLQINPSTVYDYAPSRVYRLDLSNLLAKDLSAVPHESPSMHYAYNGISNGEYRLLPDGKRVVKWSDTVVYLFNMETNSADTLYIVPQNQGLTSRFTEDEIVGYSNYDIKIDGNNIIVGVYEEINFQDDKSAMVDENNFKSFSPKFVNRVTIPIPSN